ncbi:MAG: hypothetical protein ACRCV0_05270 [Brevinema sp.]
MKVLYWLLLCGFCVILNHAETRTNNLPPQFKWRYIMDEREPSPRTGQFWRDGIFFRDKIIVLNTYNLIALDTNGNVLWIHGLPAESACSQAKIHPISEHEIIIVISDSLLRINTDTGEMLNHYNYDVSRRAAFQITQLMPRHSVLLGDHIYVFLGSQLLSFNTNSLLRTHVLNLNSPPKTLPVIFNNKILVGLENKTTLLLDPVKKQSNILLLSLNTSFETVRQPMTQDHYIYIPTDKNIHLFENNEEINQNAEFTNGILDIIEGKIWLRQHQTGILREIDKETLDQIRYISYENQKHAGKINTKLIGTNNTLVHIDSIKGQMIFFDISDHKQIKKQDEIFVEDILDNPPLQYLDQKGDFILIGAFDALYLVTLSNIKSL